MPRHSPDFATPCPRGLAIFGAGASAREVAWLAQERWGAELPLWFVVDRPHLAGQVVNGVPTIELQEFGAKFADVPVCVAVGDPTARENCVEACRSMGLGFATLVHPRVETSRWVSLGAGTIVCAGSILTTNITIGQHVHVNIDCTISHDANIGDYATLSPGVHIAGWVTLGRRVFLGTGAIVINGSAERSLTIGDDAIIGAGACVTSDVESATTVVGVPAARIIK
jgi:sugar O-acyltransferase (sialic acid O-acetyltransferase NeuD family)